jgi:hypothetical protein
MAGRRKSLFELPQAIAAGTPSPSSARAGNIDLNPIPNEFQEAFVASKARHATRKLAHAFNTHVEGLNILFGIDIPIDAPVPGGVGYGTFYQPAFQRAFSGGTEIVWAAICPPTPGGNVNSVLYCTATNRSSRGVEALLAYDPGRGPAFRIYDWSIPGDPQARPDPKWVFNLTGAALDPFISHVTVGGADLRCVPIWNSTIETAPGQWTNSVALLRSGDNNWVSQYARSYQATLADQQGEIGDWGPIVETFQPAFAGTVPLGAANVRLRAQKSGSWSAWANLAPTASTIRDDGVGFAQSYLEANYDWLITS